jgi:predicted SnoaL-like aldol condensation-catalyzing enzyme
MLLALTFSPPLAAESNPSTKPQTAPMTAQEKKNLEMVMNGAKGDFVWLIFEHEDKDPRNPANTYHYNSFDVLRIENGKVQEHWSGTTSTLCESKT